MLNKFLYPLASETETSAFPGRRAGGKKKKERKPEAKLIFAKKKKKEKGDDRISEIHVEGSFAFI